MSYKPDARKKRQEAATFTMGRTRTVTQRNGVTSTITEAVRDDGLARRCVSVFANGENARMLAAHLREGVTSTLLGKYSQHNLFVALDVVGAS